jgi:hypothetical protein
MPDAPTPVRRGHDQSPRCPAENPPPCAAHGLVSPLRGHADSVRGVPAPDVAEFRRQRNLATLGWGRDTSVVGQDTAYAR